MKSIPVRQMIKSLRPAVAAAVCLAGILPVASAQPMVLTEDAAVKRALGNGMHAFFGCDYQQAYDDLTEVVAAGSRDPRALYFRGLAARRMGRIDEAEADFSEAARLEAAAIGQWPVSQTLERVQGQDRLALERHRIRGRIAGIQAGREAELRRYSDLETTQDTYLRRRRPAVLERDPAAPFRTEELIPPPPALDSDPDPATEDADDETAEREAGDPFGSDAGEAAPAAEEEMDEEEAAEAPAPDASGEDDFEE
jgi:tetratricopeptide (TPR) repeat protein